MEPSAVTDSAARSRRPPLRWSQRLALAAAVAALAAVSLHRLGAADVCGANEAVEAVFLQQMVENGHLLFPLENGGAPMYKPPLFHWTATAIDRIAGIHRVTAWNLRLPTALYAIAGIILTLAFALDFLGPDAAALAGLILAGSYQYVENARIGRVDMTLAVCETLALFAFMWWYAPRGAPGAAPAPGRRGRDALRYLLAAALGLGVLAKGPVGAMLPALAIAIFLVAERRPLEILRLATPGPAATTVLLGASWYAACLFGRRYGFLDRQIGSENFGRFFGALGAMPPWYYLKPLLFNSFPFSLIAPVAVYAALRWRTVAADQPPPDPPSRPRQNPLSFLTSLRMMFLPALDSAIGDDPLAAPRARAAVRLGAIFYLTTVIFFSIAAYKRRAYLLPSWPILAVVIAWWIERLARRRAGRFLRMGTVAAAVIMIAVNFFYLPAKEVRDCANDSFRAAAAEINRVVGPAEPLYLYRFEDEPAPLLFYLHRTAPRISGKLGDAPPGYVLVPLGLWERIKDQALDLRPVLTTSSGRPRLVLLRRGPAYAAAVPSWPEQLNFFPHFRLSIIDYLYSEETCR